MLAGRVADSAADLRYRSGCAVDTRDLHEAGDDPVHWLVLGPDRAGNLLELVVMAAPSAS